MGRGLLLKKIINVTGTGYSGATAVAQWFGDFRDCVSLKNWECGLFRSDGGIIELSNMLLSGDIFLQNSSLARFLNLVERTEIELRFQKLEKDVSKQFRNISDNFLNSLLIERRLPWAHIFDAYNLGKIGMRCKIHSYPNTSLRNILINFLVKIAKKINGGHIATEYDYSSPRNDIFYVKDLSEEAYLRLAREYLQSFFGLFTKKDEQFIIAPCFICVETMNSYRKCERFFDNLKTIFVLRDPRDCFVSYVNRGYFNDSQVDDFCSKYLYFVREYPFNYSGIMCISFEDFILNHKKVAEKLFDFIGIFDMRLVEMPQYKIEESKQNIGKWKKYPNQKVMGQIAIKLENYLTQK